MSKNKITVLIIDDNKDFASMLEQRLTSSNIYSVIGIVDSGAIGVRTVFQEHPSVVLCDLLIPQISGSDIFRMICQVTDYNPAFIMYSTISDDDIVRDVLSLGVAHYLVQPFDADFLLTRLNTILDISTKEKLSIDLNVNPQHDLYVAETTKLLRKIGIPPHISGYHFLREAIVMVAADFNRITTMMNGVYKPIAYRNESTVSRVERAMRHAVEVACDRCRVHTLEEIFGNSISSEKDKPSNREFIAAFADKVLLNVATISSQRSDQ